MVILERGERVATCRGWFVPLFFRSVPREVVDVDQRWRGRQRLIEPVPRELATQPTRLLDASPVCCKQRQSCRLRMLLECSAHASPPFPIGVTLVQAADACPSAMMMIGLERGLRLARSASMCPMK